MRRFSILLMVLVLATASLLAAAAYSTAMVANASNVTIIATNDAHLALIPNPLFVDFVKVDSGGRLVIDFTAGHGFQPGSSYAFTNLFYVKNNLTLNNVDFGLRFDVSYPGNPSMPGLHTVSASKPATGAGGCGSYNSCLMHNNGGITCCNWNNGRVVNLAPGEQVGISFSFIVGSTQPLGSWTRDLQVHSDAIGR